MLKQNKKLFNFAWEFIEYVNKYRLIETRCLIKLAVAHENGWNLSLSDILGVSGDEPWIKNAANYRYYSQNAKNFNFRILGFWLAP